MFTIYTDKFKLKFCSELIILGGLLDIIQEKDKLRMNGLIDFCKKNITYSCNIEESDIIVLPYKLNNENDEYLQNLIQLSKIYKKRLLTFYIDDNSKKFILPNECIIYRTAFSTKDKLDNEEAIMPIIDDVFNHKYLDSPELSIGFCGQINCNRKKYLNYFYKSGLKTDFILRSITYFSIHFNKDKKIARKDYFNNIEKNLFTFCYRGYGNYSYRFYEILMMGRIPILVNTHCVIPFLKLALENGLNIIIVNEEDFIKDNKILKNSIQEFYNTHKYHLCEIQKTNRNVYEKFYSYYGFIKNIIEKYANK